METGNRRLVESLRDHFWGRGQDNQGNNVAGKILQFLRDCFTDGTSPFPSCCIFGDSILKHVQVGGARVAVMPGANTEFATTVAQAASASLVKVVVVFAGTNDIFHLDGTITSPKLVSTN